MTMNQNNYFSRRFFIILSLFMFLFVLCGDGSASDDFVIVTPTADDTFQSLAAKYLKDPSKEWVIKEFNQMKTLDPGKAVIIPARPYKLGGLQPDGYQRVPVLSYHRFSPTKAEAMVVKASAFEAQLSYLKENGYRTITIDQLFDFLEMKDQIPEKAVLITIDDGYRSMYDVAYPILKKYGFTATLFIYTDFIGSSKALSWAQLKELAQNGFSIQSQSKSHRNLAKPKDGESIQHYIQTLEEEITLPKQLIYRKLNIVCNYLAYPYGEYNSLIITLLKKEGFRGAFTTKRMSNPLFVDNFEVGRRMILGNYGLTEFKNNLAVFKKEDLK